jgi:hypothetical protein
MIDPKILDITEDDLIKNIHTFIKNVMVNLINEFVANSIITTLFNIQIQQILNFYIIQYTNTTNIKLQYL